MDEEQKERDARAGKIAWAILTRKQPTKITAVLAAAIGLSAAISKAVTRGGLALPKPLETIVLAAPFVAAAAYLIGLLTEDRIIRRRKIAALARRVSPERRQQLDEWRKSGLIDEEEYVAQLLRRQRKS